jgi:hypothetical protein
MKWRNEQEQIREALEKHEKSKIIPFEFGLVCEVNRVFEIVDFHVPTKISV